MNTPPVTLFARNFLSICICASLPQLSHAATATWIGPNNGFWDVPLNWLSGVPQNGDDVALSSSDSVFRSGTLQLKSLNGDSTLTINAGSLSFTDSASLSGLKLVNGTLAGDGSLLVTGAEESIWTDGAMLGNGTTTFLGALDMTAAGSREIRTRTVNTAGTTTYGLGQVNSITYLSTGATLNNSGTWVDQSNGNGGISQYLGAASKFVNSGTYNKTGAGTTTISTAFNNSGAVNVQAGTLSLSGGGVSTGNVQIGSAGTLAFTGGTYGLNAAGLSGTGTLLDNYGTVNLTGSTTFAGTLAVQNGTFNIADTLSLPGAYKQTGGTLGGDGNLLVIGGATWVDGAMLGNGTTTFQGALDMTAAGSREIRTRTVNTAGTTTYGLGQVNSITYLSTGATLNNSGTWVDQSNGNGGISQYLGAASKFVNSGTYNKTGAGTTTISTAFNNSGAVNVQAGTLSLSGGGVSTGNVQIGSAGTLAFTGGTYGLNAAGLSGTGTLLDNYGTVNLTGSTTFAGTLAVQNGTFNIADTLSLSGAYKQTGGTLGGDGNLLVTGGATWVDGAMLGNGTTTFQGALDMTAAGSREIRTRTLNTAGTTSYGLGQVGSITYLSTGATLNNTGTWVDQSNANSAITQYLGAQSKFVNDGVYTKTGSGVTSLNSINYLNNGITEIHQGTINLPNNFINPGTVQGVGTIGTNKFTNTGDLIVGDPLGSLSITGSFAQLASGEISFDLSSPQEHGLLLVGSSVSLDGILSLTCVNNCAFASAENILLIDGAQNALTGTFSTVNLYGFGSNVFDVVYDRAAGDVLLGVTAVPEPAQYLLLLTGFGIVGWQARKHNRKSPPHKA